MTLTQEAIKRGKRSFKGRSKQYKIAVIRMAKEWACGPHWREFYNYKL